MSQRGQLVLVSNRGPVSFEDDGEIRIGVRLSVGKRTEDARIEASQGGQGVEVDQEGLVIHGTAAAPDLGQAIQVELLQGGEAGIA